MSLLKAFVVAAALTGTATFALACPNDKSEKAEVAKVTVASAAKLHKQNKIIMVDANSPKTRTKLGVVPGARLLTSYSKFAASELKAKKSDTLVFYCYSEACGSAPKAAMTARSMGYKAKVMDAGIMGWKKAGHAVKKIKSAPNS
jgi:rhodanese-related sulfurtransferase